LGGYDEKEQTLNQLLAELDGFDPSVGVILLAATNRSEILDPALLYAERFDRQVLVDRPDYARLAILKVHVRTIHLGPDVELDKIVGLTTGFTGADWPWKNWPIARQQALHRFRQGCLRWRSGKRRRA